MQLPVGALCFCLLLCSLSSVQARAEMRTDIEFARPGGYSLTLDAYIPDGPGPHPAIIIVHGGGFNKGDKQTYVKPLFEPLSRAGFAWFTINYRLYPDYKFPANVEDVEAAVRWVKAHAKEYRVDAQKLVLMGESAGGYLVSYVGTRNKPDTRVAAVVPFYGVHDWELRAEEERAGKIPASIWRQVFSVPEGDTPEAVKRMREVSATTYIKKGLPPFLLIHGTNDKQVAYEQSVKFQERMKRAGNICDLITVAGGEHGMGIITKFPDTQVKMIAWLRKTLDLR